jgi:predicted MFS family arabinose efflux permease
LFPAPPAVPAGRGDKSGPDLAVAEPASTRARTNAPESATTRAPLGLGSALLLAAGLSLGTFVALGLARFSYGLLLPAMRSDLSWSYAQAGAMNTLNGVGYLLGALVANRVARTVGARRSFAISMAITAIALGGSGLTRSFVVLMGLRLLAGISGAQTFITGLSLAARLGGRVPGAAALLIGVCCAGGGAGIAVSAVIVPPLAGEAGPGWAAAWMAMGALAGVALLAALPALRLLDEPVTEAESGRHLPYIRRLAPTMCAYAFFGLGYFTYITFIVAHLRQQGTPTATITLFWSVLGLAALIGVVAWRPLLDRLRAARGLALINATLVVGAALPLISASPLSAYASAVLFGASFLAAPTAVTELVRREMPASAWTGGIAALTIAFAIGQCGGPALAGALSDAAGTRAGLAVAAIALGATAITSLMQRDVALGP